MGSSQKWEVLVKIEKATIKPESHQIPKYLDIESIYSSFATPCINGVVLMSCCKMVVF